MKQTQKPVTVRFSMTDYNDIAAEAENHNTTTADIIRKAWKGYQEHQNTLALLTRFESRIIASTFEICVATIGLTTDERKQAAKSVNNYLKMERVK
ncbi:TPA: hypothetical protein ACOL2D_002358 [Vibrio parahaemolyticus]